VVSRLKIRETINWIQSTTRILEGPKHANWACSP
jgi:hypothetical protein